MDIEQHHKLTRIEIFAVPAFGAVHGSTADCEKAYYIILKLSCQGDCGWGLCSILGKGVDLVRWGTFLRCIRQCSLSEAVGVTQVASQSWQPSQFAMVQTALQNLQATLYPPVLAGMFRQKNRKPKLLHLSVEQLPGASALQPAWISLDTAWLVEHSIAYYSIL
ncbi:hypothetical protein A8L34_17935 [Bacillus sp. FJAT-27264]|uniref:hypothetical protein n=1 Tax=Paenibacillus sp. (strain DSM 101736 / FJAT-27264) TaxID=1850362 RepID=UPI000807D3D7|nr:hypothetical protein [Bacillus sp. FJAT-27264]OBZ10480.1 hypothetical protein A8L34_17935 [Bacillus sp. FJAT-27264]